MNFGCVGRNAIVTWLPWLSDGHQLMGWLFSLGSMGRLCSRGLREEGGHDQGGHYQGGHHQGVQHQHGHHGLKESVCHFGWLTCRGAVGVSASGLPAGKT